MKITLVTLGILSISLISCASKNYRLPSYPVPGRETKLSYAVHEMADSLNSVLQREYKESKISFIDAFNVQDRHTDLDEYLTESFYGILNEWGIEERSKIYISPPRREDLRATMAEMKLRADRSSIKEQSNTWKKLGAHLVTLCSWESLDDLNQVKITLRVFDVKKHGIQVASISKVVSKDTQLYGLLDEKEPGKVFFASTYPEASLSCDSVSYGRIGTSGKLIEVPYGSHSFIVSRKNYVPLIKDVFVKEFDRQPVYVDFKNPKGVLLKSFLISAALPMSASWKYGSKLEKKNSVGYNIASAGSFYLVLGMYMLDRYMENSAKHDFLSEGNYDLYRNIRNAELYTALGLYGLNLFTGILIGKDYTAENRKVIEIIPTDSTKERSDSSFRTECNLLSVAIRW